jgi:hypothetical protein
MVASVVEGDRRNEGESGRRQGDRRNGWGRATVGKPPPTPAVEVLALLEAGKRDEAFQSLCHLGDSLSVVELGAAVGFFVGRNREDAARALLKSAAIHRAADMVEIALAAGRASVHM